jgi:hypothetical protein
MMLSLNDVSLSGDLAAANGCVLLAVGNCGGEFVRAEDGMGVGLWRLK